VNGVELPPAVEEAEEAQPEAAEEFPWGTLPPLITYQLRDVQPAAWLHVTPNDQLAVQLKNGQAGIGVYVCLRLLLPTGELKEIVETYSPAANRVSETYYITLPESYLLSATVVGSGGVKVGACWVRAILVYGGPKWHSFPVLLAAGYVAELSGLAWPYPRYIHPCEGPGRPRVIVGTDPAPGNQITETVPTGARWRLLTFRAQLTTNATVVDRLVFLGFDTGTQVVWVSVPVFSQSASQTWGYHWAAGLQARSLAGAQICQDALPDYVVLPAGFVIRTITAGMQAGDDWEAPNYLVEEWSEP